MKCPQCKKGNVSMSNFKKSKGGRYHKDTALFSCDSCNYKEWI